MLIVEGGLGYYRSFFKMYLTERYILQDGQRLSYDIPFYSEQQGIFKDFSELLQIETIYLQMVLLLVSLNLKHVNL
ncbi:hypothetical protein CUC15_04690 [Oceanobacillus zhaokaii]|uniref:Uncharacterized protein n=1 Tax=Oceanobacillus zhaokaii TaxID=2052660 RepID=A0A345PE44_9BACI|nr:hypothetical protein CUC15_04690 [Oceanobacillus zhaokaii]